MIRLLTTEDAEENFLRCLVEYMQLPEPRLTDAVTVFAAWLWSYDVCDKIGDVENPYRESADCAFVEMIVSEFPNVLEETIMSKEEKVTVSPRTIAASVSTCLIARHGIRLAQEVAKDVYDRICTDVERQKAAHPEEWLQSEPATANKIPPVPEFD